MKNIVKILTLSLTLLAPLAHGSILVQSPLDTPRTPTAVAITMNGISITDKEAEVALLTKGIAAIIVKDYNTAIIPIIKNK